VSTIEVRGKFYHFFCGKVKLIKSNGIEKSSVMLKHISMEKEKIRHEIEIRAKELGFDLVGFSSAEPLTKNIAMYKKWLKKGMNAEMEYMEKAAARKNIEEILPGAKTIISVAMNYYHAQPPLLKGEGRIARYAFGRDYHKIIRKKLKELENFIYSNERSLSARALPCASSKPCRARAYVDTGPILERAYAEKSGLGFIGKNSCLITKEFGSWVFLGEIVTDLALAHPKGHGYGGKPFSGCGVCTRCIDSCPTKAIIAPGVIDANKCISYLTIENKKSIPKSLATEIKKSRRLFGCDICQEVCPHNCRAKETPHKEFAEPRLAGNALYLKNLLAIKSDEEFLRRFAGSPLMRAKRAGLIRIAKIIASKSQA